MLIDFHSHFLANMDDGSKSLEMSLEMLRIEEEAGVGILCLTPHFYASGEDFDSFYARRELAYSSLRGIYNGPIELLLGCEVHFYDSIASTDREFLDKLCLAGTDLLLVELPFFRRVDLNTIVRLNDRYQVVLAHIERYLDIYSDKELDFLKENGIFFQINGEILDKIHYNNRVRRLFEYQSVNFIGSDSHNLTNRRPNILSAKKFLVGTYGRGVFDDFVEFSYGCYGERKRYEKAVDFII